jgi:hypothetical protein
MRGWRWLETFLQDVRYGLRQFRRNPGFTAVAVLSLALGIGATIAIFSVMYALAFRRLPVQRPDELVEVGGLAAEISTRMHCGNFFGTGKIFCHPLSRITTSIPISRSRTQKDGKKYRDYMSLAITFQALASQPFSAECCDLPMTGLARRPYALFVTGCGGSCTANHEMYSVGRSGWMVTNSRSLE